MPEHNLKEYLTIGELAALYQIPKQTLIYYATNGIIKPAFVNENGYRYYSVNEFLVLEIILNLRKLDISSGDIKEFVFNRSTENIVKILNDKKNELRDTIDSLNRTIGSIDYFLDNINQQEHLLLNCFQTLQLPAEKIVVNKPFDETSTPTRLLEFASHNQYIFPKNVFRSAPTGWIISKEDYFEKNKPHQTKQYFTPLPPEYNRKNITERPAGLYVLYNFNRSFFVRCPEIRNNLIEYLKRNNLKVIGDIYILPLKNHWQSENSDDYISRLTVQVAITKTK